MPNRLRLQRWRAVLLGGGCVEEPVSEHVSEVSQLGCEVCSCSGAIAAALGPADACMQGGLCQAAFVAHVMQCADPN